MKIDDKGTTTLETLIAVVIISLAGTLVFAAATLVMSSASKTSDAVRIISSVTVADRLMRDLVGGIRVPYWERTAKFTGGTDSLELPWYRGRRDELLSLAVTEEGLEIKVPGTDAPVTYVVLRRMKNIQLELIESAGGQTSGVAVSWDASSVRYRSTLPFGSFFHEGRP